jgi:hypothetical protein
MTAPASGPSARTAVLGLAGALVLAYPLRYVLLPFAVAAALACLLRPAVGWAECRLRLPHAVAAALACAVTAGALGGIGWWLAVRRGGVGAPKPWLVWLYDNLGIPLTRTLERIVRPPFGQTVFCVAVKPE